MRDEEARLPVALASVAFCDEIVVVDSGSTDRTVEIARAAGAVVVENPWPGFGAQRNVAIDHATSDWVLEIDADEHVSPELRADIRRFLAAVPPGVDIAALPLRQHFLGAWLGPSAKYPMYRMRLMRRGAYRHDEGRAVHEGLWPATPPHALTGDLEHELAGSWGEALRDTLRYAALEASRLPGRHTARQTFFGIFVRPPAKVVSRLFVDGGWRDGGRGLAHILLAAASDLLVEVRISLRRGRPGAATDGHFGDEVPPVGPVKIVGIAAGETAAGEAAQWLGAAAAHGADVALVSDAADDHALGIRTRAVARCGPLHVARALDAEQQLRPHDAVVVFGRRAAARVRLVPRGLLGRDGASAPTEDAAAAVAGLTARTRP